MTLSFDIVLVLMVSGAINLVCIFREKYMNQEKREEHFDPMGYFRTNPKMVGFFKKL